MVENGMVVGAADAYDAQSRPVSAEAWGHEVSDQLRTVTVRDVLDELYDGDVQESLREALRSGDAAQVGAVVLRTRQALAERLAAREQQTEREVLEQLRRAHAKAQARRFAAEPVAPTAFGELSA